MALAFQLYDLKCYSSSFFSYSSFQLILVLVIQHTVDGLTSTQSTHELG
jgi:hypothetical protein